MVKTWKLIGEMLLMLPELKWEEGDPLGYTIDESGNIRKDGFKSLANIEYSTHRGD